MTLRVLLLVSVGVGAALLGYILMTQKESTEPALASGSNSALERPAIPEASASSFLETEAGMAGYTKLDWTIPVEDVWPDLRRQFRTIEKETEEYIVGTVSMSIYPWPWDPHVYIDKDGWLVVYYSSDRTPAYFI